MIINHNTDAINAWRHMSINKSMLAKTAERLSSGLAINRASDNPSGLVVSKNMQSQIIGLEQSSRNAQDDISAIQVADGALGETTSILKRMKQLATEAANGTLKDQDRKNIQCEINQLTSEVNSIGNNTEFNTIKLLSSDEKKNWEITSQLVIKNETNSGQHSEFQVNDMRAKALNISGDSDGKITSKDGKVTAQFAKVDVNDKDNGVTNGNDSKIVEYALDVSDAKNASAAIKIYGEAIGKVSSFRAGLGGLQKALEYRIDRFENTTNNVASALSRIEDADMAKEIANYSRYNILSQASQAMLAQADHGSERVLELLKSS